MKKTSVISVFVFVAMATFFSFTFNKTSDAKKLEALNPTGTIVNVLNCDNCNEVFVCVNGTKSYHFKSCTFYVDCDPDGPQIQTICVTCGDKTGIATMNCDYQPRAVYITVENSGDVCDCGQTKKKKK